MSKRSNVSIDTDPQLQEAALPLVLVVRSFVRPQTLAIFGPVPFRPKLEWEDIRSFVFFLAYEANDN